MKQVRALVAVALLILTSNTALASGTTVRSVRLVPRAGAVAIVVQADGPLPLPSVGVLAGPPRIYLDFRNVTTAATGIRAEGNAVVRRVRVALNQPQPPVTRVVVELAQAASHRVEADNRERGELTVVIGAPAGAQPAPPSLQVTAPQTRAPISPPKPRRELVPLPATPGPAVRRAAPASPTPSGAAPRTPTAATVLRSVQLAPAGNETAITVKADGPLPAPAIGVLGGPPRIYLDFRNVTTATPGTRVERPVFVRRVRVGLNQAGPPITRVVIDLARTAPYRLEADKRQRGELTVIIGAPAGTQAAPPLPQIATPQASVRGASPGLRREPTAPPAAGVPAGRSPAAPAAPPLPSAPSRTPSAGASATVLRSVRLAPGWGELSVILEADGPLPSPSVRLFEGSPHIYLDFPNVATTTAGILVEGHPVVRQVRVALNQVQPPVTRVVIELARAVPYRIEEDARQRGKVAVIVDAAGAAGLAPSVPGSQATPSPAPLSAEAAPARVAAAPPPTAAPREATAQAPAKDIERYLQQASTALDRLERLRPLLSSLDGLKPVSGVQLKAAADEFQSIRQTLAGIGPPPTLKATHELLSTVCALGALSATTRLEAVARGDAAGAWNAASAAASAMMLLDRARGELGVAPVGSPEKK